MSAFSDWYTPRRRTILWVCAGYTSFLLVFAATWALAPRLAPVPQAVDRLLLALQWTALPALVLLAQLQGLWRLGDTVQAEADPLAGAESRRFKINQRVLSNTIEQTLMFVPVIVAVSIRTAPEHVFLLPWLVAIWSVGRMLFWAGYQVQPHYRAIGMDWTTSANLVAVGWLLTTVF